jgi:signal transduction histidine kinase
MNKIKFSLLLIFFSSRLYFAQVKNSNINSNEINVNKLLDSARVYAANAPSKSILFAEKALNLSIDNNYYKGKSFSYRALASAYRNMANYSLAFEYLFKALEIDEKYNNFENLALTYNDLGLVYFLTNNYDKALENYLKGLNFAERIGNNSKIISNLYNNIGTVFQVTGKFSKAEEYLLKALNIFEINKDSLGISRLLNNLGYLNEVSGNNLKALDYYQKSLDLKIKLNNKQNIANTMQNLASIYLSLNQPDKAISFLNESINIANIINDKKLIADGYLLLTFCYFYKKDLNQSLYYKNLYSKVSAEINREDQKRKIAELLVKNRMEQKEKENLYLSRLTTIQRYYMLIIGTVFFVIVIILITMNRNKKKINKQLVESTEQLEKRIRLIEFLSSYSSKLINIQLDEIDNNIVQVLKFISEFTDKKLVALFTYSFQNKVFNLRQKYINEDFTFDLEQFNLDNKNEKFLSPIFLDKPLILELKNDLLEIFKDKIDYKIKSIIIVPIKLESKLWGIIIAGDTNLEQHYNEELLNIFSLTGEILANAAKRKINEEKLVFYSKELEEINRSKDRFYSMVSHDLKSPFQGLLGMTSFIINEADDLTVDEIKEYVGNIESSARNLYNLLENLLNWTRFELGRIQFCPEEFNLAELLEEITGLINVHAKKKDIRLIYDVPKDLNIVADRKMIYSVLSNLLINGIKFSYPNNEVTVIAVKTDSGVVIKVCDKGIGMTNEQINNLFDIKNIKSTAGTNNEKGTGLGLLLCGEMIEKHNGKIEVISAVNKGTCFVVSIPQ